MRNKGRKKRETKGRKDEVKVELECGLPRNFEKLSKVSDRKSEKSNTKLRI